MATNQLRRKPIGIIIFMYDDDDEVGQMAPTMYLVVLLM